MTPARASGARGWNAGPFVAELQNVTKFYGKRAALRNFSLALEPGEIVVLLGPNGAGKTSAMHVLTGLRRAESGSVRLFGSDPRVLAVRRMLGVTPQQLGFPPTLRVREILDLVRAHYPRPLAPTELAERFALEHLLDRAAAGLSLGEQRRLAVAAAFAGDPPLVVLDEPTTGLDVESRHAVWSAIRAYSAHGGTVFLTTHYLEEAELLASRVAVVDHGRVIFNGSVEQIKARLGRKRVLVRRPVVLPIADVAECAVEDGVYVLRTSNVTALVQELLRREVTCDDFEIEPISLERAFLDLTEHVSR